MYQFGADKFGTTDQQKHEEQQARLSRRQRGIRKLRRELRVLKGRWKLANSRKGYFKRLGVEELRNQHRDNLKKLRRAERMERKAKEH